jgi:hypothetical protein
LDLGAVHRGGRVRGGADCGAGREPCVGLGDPGPGWRARGVHGEQNRDGRRERAIGFVGSGRQPSVGVEGAISVDSAGGSHDEQLCGCSDGAAGYKPSG